MEPALILVSVVCVAVIVWVYLGYPAALASGLFGRRRTFLRANMDPAISVIIPARNEESAIESKLQNLLAADYPRERLEILVGSDGSSDRTAQIVERFAGLGVGLLSFPQHVGKSAIQNGLVGHASGSILVFTDADCLVSPDALAKLIENFADPRVGLVTASPVYVNVRETPTCANESLYVRYETWLRTLESERGLLAMASGSLFAMRRSLWQPLDVKLGDDFVLPLRVARAGLQNVIDPRVVATTRLTHANPSAMLRLKMRVISKDFGALLAARDLLNPLRRPRLAFALWSHKLLRWFVPYFLLALFAGSVLLSSRPLFAAVLGAQLCFYALALLPFFLRGRLLSGPLSLPLSFCVVNLAALLGTSKALFGRISGAWEPERAAVPHRPGESFDPQISLHEIVKRVSR